MSTYSPGGIAHGVFWVILVPPAGGETMIKVERVQRGTKLLKALTEHEGEAEAAIFIRSREQKAWLGTRSLSINISELAGRKEIHLCSPGLVG